MISDKERENNGKRDLHNSTQQSQRRSRNQRMSQGDDEGYKVSGSVVFKIIKNKGGSKEQAMDKVESPAHFAKRN